MKHLPKITTLALGVTLAFVSPRASAQEVTAPPARKFAPSFDEIEVTHVQASDTTKALIRLFRRKNVIGKVGIFIGTGSLATGAALGTFRYPDGNTNRALAATPVLRYAWVIYGASLVVGAIRTQLHSRQRLLTVLEAYQRTGTLPEKYRKKLRPDDFR